ncbi:MAG: DUF4920 domain-containing protein [Sandaracinaceae bacterium]|nr:DUF4920 domain-containing protein [Sandaracinaceae bacterium]
MRSAVRLAAIVLLAGCGRAEPSARLGESAPSAPAAQPSPREPAASTFGAALDEGLPLTPLSAIVAEPERFRDQVVRTEGEIAQVCQRMGCWMELREGDGPRVRVPMAGHAFFLPRDAVGRHATMQGRVTLRPLTDDVRAHLESEGAQATASTLSIDATGVVIDGAPGA